MRHSAICSLALFVLSAAVSPAQATPTTPTARIELGANYNWLHANAPAGQCGCFSSNGGSGIAVVALPHRIALVADISGSHANALNGTTQNITVMNYLFGGRYSLSVGQRTKLYGQGLVGLSHEASNYAYAQNREAIAYDAGGGVSLRLTKRFGWNALQVDWLHSNLPNATNDRQNDLRLGTGFFVSIGHSTQ